MPRAGGCLPSLGSVVGGASDPDCLSYFVWVFLKRRCPDIRLLKTLLSSSDKTFHKVSPFLIQKLIVSFLGDVKDVKKLKSGDLLIEAATKSQISALKSLKKIGSS
ncbi:hypothetical protein AVEN_208085-1 [Araneus ventricosus]|uniref:Uncharacterized protein n=1 Tax=Araneus ventricosus TaxID=182803 RepID=A0A4Y2FZA5_ARAVE|nr:hypothetical protein AVEN_208085-1 [Araneus ventricosus]